MLFHHVLPLGHPGSGGRTGIGLPSLPSLPSHYLPSTTPHLRIRSGMYKRRMHMKVFWIVANICISVSPWRAGTLFCLSLNFFHHVGLLDRKVNMMTFWKLEEEEEDHPDGLA